jgi:hypothetical protein
MESRSHIDQGRLQEQVRANGPLLKDQVRIADAAAEVGKFNPPSWPMRQPDRNRFWLAHLTYTVPSSPKGMEICDTRNEFQQALQRMNAATTESGPLNVDGIRDALNTITSYLFPTVPANDDNNSNNPIETTTNDNNETNGNTTTVASSTMFHYLFRV